MLTTRQWALYNYLKELKDWIPQLQIAIDLNEYYPIENMQSFHDSTIRLHITSDIRAINNSDIIQKLIISSPCGIKIATAEEAGKYIKGKYAAVFRKLERVRKIEKKASLDEQYRLVLGHEREVVFAFSDSNKLGEIWRNVRKDYGLTQKQAAERMSEYTAIDEPMLSKIENGICLPSKEQVTAFNNVYSAIE